MTDLVTVASQISTPIKVGWVLWLIWLIVQIGSYRWLRQAAAAHSAPVAHQPSIGETVPALEPMTAQAEEPAPEPAVRRRRRRRPRHQDEGVGQEVEATA